MGKKMVNGPQNTDLTPMRFGAVSSALIFVIYFVAVLIVSGAVDDYLLPIARAYRHMMGH